MNMGMIEDFEKLKSKFALDEREMAVARAVWCERQPEIDALNAELGSRTAKLVKANGLIENWKERCDMLDMEVHELKAENERARKAYLEYEQENFLLKAENERLRSDWVF